jgi:putative flippase GtrA
MCDICGIHEIISNITAYIISATNSYLLNSRFVFRDGKYTYKSYLKFLSANTFVLVISTLSVFLLSQRVSYKITAKLISIPINFIFLRFIVFKKSAECPVNESEEEENA